jgi:hypothetical protein
MSPVLRNCLTFLHVFRTSSGVTVRLPRHELQQAGDEIPTTLLAIIRTYQCENLQVTERYEHNVFRKVSSKGAWLIENGKGLRHLVSLLEVRTAVTSFKLAERRYI